MRRLTYQHVKQYFLDNGCELLEDAYANNATKMNFMCRCGAASQVSFGQFKKSPQCNRCGLEQMKKSKMKEDMEKKCRVCDIALTEENKKKRTNRTNYGSICHKCFNERGAAFQKTHGKKYYKKHHKERIAYFDERRKQHPEAIREQGRCCAQKLKTEVLKHYCPELRCERCGFNEHLAGLSIDHIYGGGNKHRKQIGSMSFYRWLKKNHYPDGFQVLCMSCQCVKRFENNECNRSIKQSSQNKYYHNLRMDILSHYSQNMSCAKCGNTHLAALSIDHMDGDGAKHRKEVGNCVYHWLKNNDYPVGFQVLCMTCQYIKRWENGEFRKAHQAHL